MAFDWVNPSSLTDPGFGKHGAQHAMATQSNSTRRAHYFVNVPRTELSACDVPGLATGHAAPQASAALNSGSSNSSDVHWWQQQQQQQPIRQQYHAWPGQRQALPQLQPTGHAAQWGPVGSGSVAHAHAPQHNGAGIRHAPASPPTHEARARSDPTLAALTSSPHTSLHNPGSMQPSGASGASRSLFPIASSKPTPASPAQNQATAGLGPGPFSSPGPNPILGLPGYGPLTSSVGGAGPRRFMSGLRELKAGPSEQQRQLQVAQKRQLQQDLDEQVRQKREREARIKAQEQEARAKVRHRGRAW